MAGTAQLFDKRSEFFRSYFNKGAPYAAYVATGTPEQQRRWQQYEEALKLTEPQHKLLTQCSRQVNVLVMSGIWCGDCARQCPLFPKISAANPKFSFRFLDNKEHPELQDELRIQGGTRVPVVVALSEDFFEIARFGDRTLSAYRRKARNELGPACPVGLIIEDAEALETEVSEWMQFFERVHLVARLSPFLRQRHRD